MLLSFLNPNILRGGPLMMVIGIDWTSFFKWQDPSTSSTFNIIKNPSVYKYGGSLNLVLLYAILRRNWEACMASDVITPPPSLTCLGKFFFQRIWVGILTMDALNTLMWKYGSRELLNILNYSAAWIFHFSDVQFASFNTANTCTVLL